MDYSQTIAGIYTGGQQAQANVQKTLADTALINEQVDVDQANVEYKQLQTKRLQDEMALQKQSQDLFQKSASQVKDATDLSSRYKWMASQEKDPAAAAELMKIADTQDHQKRQAADDGLAIAEDVNQQKYNSIRSIMATPDSAIAGVQGLLKPDPKTPEDQAYNAMLMNVAATAQQHKLDGQWDKFAQPILNKAEQTYAKSSDTIKMYKIEKEAQAKADKLKLQQEDEERKARADSQRAANAQIIAQAKMISAEASAARTQASQLKPLYQTVQKMSDRKITEGESNIRALQNQLDRSGNLLNTSGLTPAQVKQRQVDIQDQIRQEQRDIDIGYQMQSDLGSGIAPEEVISKYRQGAPASTVQTPSDVASMARQAWGGYDTSKYVYRVNPTTGRLQRIKKVMLLKAK